MAKVNILEELLSKYEAQLEEMKKSTHNYHSYEQASHSMGYEMCLESVIEDLKNLNQKKEGQNGN
jgi:nitrogenase molybdenum-iron protein alpha/beta subunit